LNKGSYWHLEDDTKLEILRLIKTCSLSNLGNLSFEYYATTLRRGARFYMQEIKNYWELVVTTDIGRDIYHITNDEISYKYSDE
jgi:hypothetical protein